MGLFEPLQNGQALGEDRAIGLQGWNQGLGIEGSVAGLAPLLGGE